MTESLFSLFEYKSDSLLMKEQFTLFKIGKTAWTLDLKIYIRLFGFVFIKTKREQIALLKRAQERFTLFCQKTSNSHIKPKSEFKNPEIVEQDVLV